MARDTTERNVRRDPSLREGERDPRIDQNRRFYTARGYDQGVRNARALQAAFGLAGDVYTEHLEVQNEKGAKQALADAAAGVRQEGQNKGYEETYQRVEAANDLAEMNRDLSKQLTEAGWEDLPQEEVQGMIDEFFRGQLEGVNPESVYGSLMGQGILKANADLLDVHNSHALAKDQQERRTMLLNAARQNFETDDALDHEQIMKDSATLLPGPGGRMNYVELVATLAEEYGRPDLLETIPETFPNGEPTGINDPKFRKDVLNPAIAKAEAAKQRMERTAQIEQLEQTAGMRASVKADLDVRAASGDFSIVPEVLAGMAPTEDGSVPLLTEAEGRTMLRNVQTAQRKAAVAYNHDILFEGGNAFGLTPTEYNDVTLRYMEKRRAKHEQAGLTGDDLAAAVMADVIQKSIDHDRVPKFLSDQMLATTANPDRLASAADMRRLIEENKPGLVQRAIGDRANARLDAYEHYMTETGGDVNRTIEMMEQADPTLSEGRSKEITEIANAVVDELADDAKWFGSAGVSQRDRRRAEALTRIYMEQGVDDERLPEMVENAFKARNRFVGGVMYPADFGWGSKAEESLDWFLNGGSGDYWPEDANLVAEPHPTQRGVILVRDTESGLLYRAPYNVKDIQSKYEQSIMDQVYTSAQGSGNTESEFYKEARNRAAERMFPDMSRYAEPGSREDFFGSPIHQFNRLSPQEQAAAIQAELELSK